MSRGKLIIIGGHENKTNGGDILEHVANAAADGGRLVIITTASTFGDEVGKEYEAAFKEHGVKDIATLDIKQREDGFDEERVKTLEGAKVIFFTGGDQLRITSHIGDTPVFRTMRTLYEQGTMIAGTSAGAAAMPTTMLISGAGDESGRMSAIGMAPGLGFIENVVIDSHFAERGRIGRLLGAVAQNPANLGLGIDEDTAIVVKRGQRFQVIGTGAVYALDGSSMTYSSVSEEEPEGVLSIYDVRLHVLGEGDQFDLNERHPLIPEPGE